MAWWRAINRSYSVDAALLLISMTGSLITRQMRCGHAQFTFRTGPVGVPGRFRAGRGPDGAQFQ
ncbi:hypothetical protein GCM10010505_06110 [Kitasatospora aburaviensis]